MSATVSEADSMTPGFVREQLPVETRKAIIDVERRQSIIEQQAEEQPLRVALDPIFRMQALMGTPTRNAIIRGLEEGGAPVFDERGMTVGVVRKGAGLFGGSDYVGRPDYNPIAARVNRVTGTGDQGPTFQQRNGGYQAVSQRGAAISVGDGTLKTTTGQPVVSARPPAAPQPRKSRTAAPSRAAPSPAQGTLMGGPSRGPVQGGAGGAPLLY